MLNDVIQDSVDDDVDDMIEDVAGMRGMARDMGEIVDDMEDIDDEYVEDMMDDVVDDSDQVYDSDDAAGPSRDSRGRKQGTSRASEQIHDESSPEMDRKQSGKAGSKFQDEPEEDIDNYSDGGLNTNLNDDGSRPDLLNFNQVEKDSSIQQIKTHEDSDKLISSGSKGSDIEEVDDSGRNGGGVSPPKASSSRLSREDRLGLQASSVKSRKDRIEEDGGVSANGMSPPSRGSPTSRIVDSENYEDDIEDQADPSKSGSIQMSKGKSISKSVKHNLEAPDESIADDYS